MLISPYVNSNLINFQQSKFNGKTRKTCLRCRVVNLSNVNLDSLKETCSRFGPSVIVHKRHN